MFRFLMCVVVALSLVSVAHAAPRHRRYYTPSQVQTSTKSYAYTSAYSGQTSTAQGVAELQASNGRMGHHGGNSGLEGVGMGSSPEQALGNCCYSNSGRAVVDQGVARGRDGRWYACKRYR